MKDLKVGLIQLNTNWEDPRSNKEKIENIIKFSQNLPDLIILPEMFLTGFSCEYTQSLEIDDGTSTLSWLQDLSLKYTVALAGSIKIMDNSGNLRNRFIFCDKESKQYYDKRHLFPLSAEAKNFTAGSERKLFSFLDWSICPQICYDLRFPVWGRNTQNYDLMINVANWPSSRKYAWRTLLIARAIENQTYVIGVNRTGTDHNGLVYNGNSYVISPEGNVLLEANDDQKLLQLVLSKNELLKTRLTLPFLKDMDPFTFGSFDHNLSK